MATIKMTTNIPVHASVKFADIVPGQYGPQVRLKGTFDGEDGLLFLPGKVWANLKALKSAGVVAQGDYNEEPTEPVELPLLHRDIVLTRSQPAGAKYADLVVTTNGATPPQSKPQGKQPVNIGGPLPGEYDDEPPHPADEYDHAATKESIRTSLLSLTQQQYTAALDYVLGTVYPRLVKADIPVDGSAVNAMVATILIQASKS